jgi:hypothetical protein
MRPRASTPAVSRRGEVRAFGRSGLTLGIRPRMTLPRAALKMDMTTKEANAPPKTVIRGCREAMMAAMRNVLSPAHVSGVFGRMRCEMAQFAGSELTTYRSRRQRSLRMPGRRHLGVSRVLTVAGESRRTERAFIASSFRHDVFEVDGAV